MKIISHRGNLTGSNPRTENTLEQFDLALSKGFEVEIDVWRIHENTVWIGHDSGDIVMPKSFLEENSEKIWVHAKSLVAVNSLRFVHGINWFWHENDKMTITSKGYIWCYPGTYIDGGISVVTDKEFQTDHDILGICTDFAENWIRT